MYVICFKIISLAPGWIDSRVTRGDKNDEAVITVIGMGQDGILARRGCGFIDEKQLNSGWIWKLLTTGSTHELVCSVREKEKLRMRVLSAMGIEKTMRDTGFF